ncbi:hypothetical protein OSB04_010934 [Centaurea solstitialis]|uniref:Uncharacterized protein n=1 Tax=Centaurea solstitialis TaxID=347529 RepID=A0AA38T8H6_9ASTR|nr:hypothetical protein OSB04_010934 [Centaurea solstitialis]
MESITSSFLSTFSPPSSVVPPPPRSSLPPPLPFRVLSIRIEEKPQTTTISKRSSKKPEERPTPLLNNEKHIKKPAVLTNIFNAFDDIINKFIDQPLRDVVDPRHVLSGNFYPVDELPPTECEVSEGTLPSCLDGVYLRNGPNPHFLPRGPYHLFDGDGMLHAIRISKGKATLCSRYVKTYKYNIEEDAGSPIVPNMFSGFNSLTASVARMTVTIARILAGQFNPFKGFGLANTSLALFGNKLLALGESDLPYAIKLTPEGDIITLGRHDFDGKLFMSMTAHPKLDPVTKEVFAFRYSLLPPYLTFFWFDEKGEKQPNIPIFSKRSATFLHDFAITKNYAIFLEIQLGMSLTDMFHGGSPVSVNLGKVPRLGVIPRYAKDESEMKWFEVLDWNSLHIINAWEEEDGDKVVMVAPNLLSVEHMLERMDLVHASMEKVTINLKTGMVSRQPLSTRNLELAVINPAFLTFKNRYIYCGVGDPLPKASGIVKLDVSLSEVDRQDCIIASRMFGPGCFGSEPFFVAREPDNRDADEDDGYIVSYVHNENTGESSFWVMDAKSSTLEIVAILKLPQRVPYGFHGLFVKESDIKKL